MMTIQEWSGIDLPFESDSECILLLPVLVERGYCYRLKDIGSGTMFEVWRKDDDYSVASKVKHTISAAISSAVLELIEKEGKE